MHMQPSVQGGAPAEHEGVSLAHPTIPQQEAKDITTPLLPSSEKVW